MTDYPPETRGESPARTPVTGPGAAQGAAGQGTPQGLRSDPSRRGVPEHGGSGRPGASPVPSGIPPSPGLPSGSAQRRGLPALEDQRDDVGTRARARSGSGGSAGGWTGAAESGGGSGRTSPLVPQGAAARHLSTPEGRAAFSRGPPMVAHVEDEPVPLSASRGRADVPSPVVSARSAPWSGSGAGDDRLPSRGSGFVLTSPLSEDVVDDDRNQRSSSRTRDVEPFDSRNGVQRFSDDIVEDFD